MKLKVDIDWRADDDEILIEPPVVFDVSNNGGNAVTISCGDYISVRLEIRDGLLHVLVAEDTDTTDGEYRNVHVFAKEV